MTLLMETLNTKKFYVYKHVRLDTREVFYIGKGHGNRASHTKRNKYWMRIVGKTPYKISIIRDHLHEEDAFKLEKFFIAKYKNKGQCKANFTQGGEGTSGLVPWNKGIPMTDETRLKVSIAKKNPSNETRKRISEAGLGRSPWNKGKKLSEDHVAKLSKAKLGKVYSQQYKDNMAKVKGSNKLFRVFKKDTLDFVGSWYGKKTCANDLGIDRSGVCKCLRGKMKSHKGYIFKS